MSNEQRLEQLRQRVEQQPMSRLLGVKLEELYYGHCVLSLPAKEGLLRPAGMFNGSAILSLADIAAGYAVAATGQKETDYYVTTDLHNSFLRKAVGDKLIARAHVIRPGQKLSVVQVHIFVPAGVEEILVALSTVSFMKIAPL